MAPQGVPASTRINAPKSPQFSTPPAKNAVEERMEERRRRKHRRQSGGAIAGGEDIDEKMRISRAVKNLVKRIRMEQNLLDAYSGEGWKGRSREKVRPEMELQRANSQILRCKLGIRDLMRDLNNLGKDGSLQQSAFDEEGRIFHEDIFCSKCKSREASLENDIILCDGACDRGFHQNCLEPPMPDLPPDDEGWLCPICDFKLECLNHINGHLGTDYQVEDQWESVFAAEAARSVGGPSDENKDDWPSEDSDDDDYDPESKAVQEDGKQNGDGARERGLESLSGSQSEPEASSGSEVDVDELESSDVSGDDLGGTETTGPEMGMSSGAGRHAGDDIGLEAQTPPATGRSGSLLGKRRRQPVDYKRLNAEMFGKEDEGDGSDSDDEEWGQRKGRRKKSAKNDGVRETDAVDGSATEKSKDRVPEKSSVGHPSGDGSNGLNELGEKVNGSVTKMREGLSDDRRTRRLPGIVVQTLRKEFDSGSRFPNKAYKMSLAEKLGISFQQVSGWFKNARRVSRHERGQRTSRIRKIVDVTNVSLVGVNVSPVDGNVVSPVDANAVSSVDANVSSVGVNASSVGDTIIKTTTRGRGAVEEIEVTNGLLVEKLDEVQLKLYQLKHTLEAIKAQPDSVTEARTLGGGGLSDPGLVMSPASGQHILYVPIADVVEKDSENPPANQ